MKRLTALLAAALILLLAFSAMPVEAAEAEPAPALTEAAEIPQTGDLSELTAVLFVLCAGGIITTVYWKHEM